MKLQIKKLSSLCKVFLDEEPMGDYVNGEIFQNERLSFQLGYCAKEDITLADFFLTVSTSHTHAVQLFTVENVPSALPCYPDADDDYLRRAPGLFPDVLVPLTVPLRLTCPSWHALWFEIDCTQCAIGEQSILVTLAVSDGTVITTHFDFTVLPGFLPKQRLICTQWLHYDCLSDFYHVKPLSVQHMKRVWQYVDHAVCHGMNMLLIPLVTPPLDTLPGHERPTVQLLDITLQNGTYTFGFTRLHRFLNTALRHGIVYFEMTPLFTQWGAAHAPKIMANVNGRETQIFGWETQSDSPAYTSFLRAMLCELADKLKQWGLQTRCYFHISDEPQEPEHFLFYKKAYTLMADCLPGFEIMDTLSSAAFYKEGFVKHPIAATDAFERLTQAGAQDMWVYYCCAQYKKVSNHFMAMPPRRTRIFGAQLYRQNVWGFLHWGFNFWNGKYSERHINPYAVTDAGGVFPSGDPFLVYPGNDGPVSSTRQKVLREALYDNRALQWLEMLCGRAAVCSILDSVGPLTFEEYPRSENALLHLRHNINMAILKANTFH